MLSHNYMLQHNYSTGDELGPHSNRLQVRCFAAGLRHIRLHTTTYDYIRLRTTHMFGELLTALR